MHTQADLNNAFDLRLLLFFGLLLNVFTKFSEKVSEKTK